VNDGKRQALLDEAAENATRLSGGLQSLLSRIRDAALGMPGGSDFEAVRRGPRSVIVCKLHDIDLTDCERAYRDGKRGEPCTDGIPVSAPNDPVGEAAITPDRARIDEERLTRLVENLHRTVEQILDLAQHYAPRASTPKDRRDSSDEYLGCGSCRRVRGPASAAWWNAPYTKGPTDVTGILPSPMLLCRACYDRIYYTGAMPTTQELEYYRDHGRWPRQHKASVR
jgi:hypothetical protein